MSDKTDWASMDKRVRDRKITWSKDEKKALDDGLGKLPDLAEKIELIEIAQPALGSSQEEEEGEDGERADGADAAN